jgi:GNAT superfamily N-acetyltransferase
MDHKSNSTSHKIIKLTDTKGIVSWMLFSETRMIVRSGSNDGLYTDQIDIQLQVMGSFEQRATGGAVAMEMRGRAGSGITIGTVNFSDGYIVVEPPWMGLRIGTYMMNHLVAWAKENYPDSLPVGIRLGINQAGAENKERRNRFYAIFGFKFKWDDDEQREGHLDSELRIYDLDTTEKWEERITEFSFKEGMKEIFSESDQIRLAGLNSDNRVQSAINAMNYARLRLRSAAPGGRAGDYTGWYLAWL